MKIAFFRFIKYKDVTVEMAILCFSVGIFILLGNISSSARYCSVNTPGVYTFGPECQYMCHCKNGKSCDTDTGECSGGCDTNWFGPACQYRDLAEYQFSRQNSNKMLPEHAVKAIDGVTSTCSYTEESSLSTTKPWWRVWFPQNETIRDIYIYTRNATLEYFLGFEVTVEFVPKDKHIDSDYVPTLRYTCYQHDDTVPGSKQIHVHCEQALVGNQVRITLSKAQAQLVLCDVRIDAGRNFAFRKYATANHYKSMYPPLNAVDGRLGFNISSNWTYCFVSSTTGLQFLDVNLGRSVNTYSVNINTNTDVNIKDYKIYATTATQTGLQLMYDDRGNMPPVTYVHLSSNVLQLRIQKGDDFRMAVCELEIYGECPANKCGFDCSENCYCKSYEKMEQRISGVCTSGCQGRWTGTAGKCNIECHEKKWGRQCQYDCGACRNGTCDVVSGKCTGCCQDGYYNTDDYKSEDSIQQNTIATIAGYVLAGIVVICVTIVVVTIIMYRRRQPPSVITQHDSHGENSNNPTSISYVDLQRNASTNNNYETIDPENV